MVVVCIFIRVSRFRYVFYVVPKISLKMLVWKEGEHYVAQCLNVDVSSFGFLLGGGLLQV
jgi:hypothetical protein